MSKSSLEKLEPSKIVALEPAVDSFLEAESEGQFWPEGVAKNPAFIEQIQSRKSLIEALERITAKIPKPDIAFPEALAHGYVTEREIADFYQQLGNFLKKYPENKRILLYLPFEYLPRVDWHPQSPKLQSTLDDFRDIYFSSWAQLLSQQDISGNFVDGEALDEEVRAGTASRVVKAAHLIPKLLEAEIIDLDLVINLVEENQNDVFQKSVADTFPVSVDLGLVDTAHLATMKSSKSNILREAAERISSINPPSTPEKIPVSLDNLQDFLDKNLEKIQSEEHIGASKTRINWLQKDARAKLITAVGKEIAKEFINNESVDNFLNEDVDLPIHMAIIEGIRRALESKVSDVPEKARRLYEHYKPALMAIWEYDIPELRDELKRTFCRLKVLGVVQNYELSKLGISEPNFTGKFAEKIQYMSEEIGEIEKIVGNIAADPELSKWVFPTVLLSGSRFKGYGRSTSDIDIAVFIKPETQPSNRPRIKELFKKYFSHDRILGEVVEFWLAEKGDHFQVQDFDQNDPSFGKSHWAHLLFGSAWVGESDSISQLKQKVLVPYLHKSDQKLFGIPAHRIYLDELERSILQYRLMHRGYAEFMPPFGGVNTEHRESIGGSSAFWDSGYRQVATKLFLKKVFLPQI